jgi:hypothetical protein
VRAPGFFLAWFLVALVAGISGTVAALHPPVPQLVLVGLTVGLVVLERQAGWLRSWVAAARVRGLVALHLTRLGIGIVFLMLGRRGELATAFAVPAGWGDIAVGSLAGLLLLTGDVTLDRRALYRVWNGLGLLDLVFVVATAARLALADPASMQALLRWPLGLVPTFLVPLLLATHVWLFRRLATPTKA